MVWTKITINNSVKYTPSVNSSTSEKSHNHKPKTTSTPRNQNKPTSQNNKKFLKNIKTEGFRTLE